MKDDAKRPADAPAEKYPGTPPGWKPDEVWAHRGFDSMSIENQAKFAAERWAVDPENPKNAQAAADTAPAHEVKDSDL